jgi:hypothetical protein
MAKSVHWAAILAAAAVAGCASAAPKSACAEADWGELGERDGLFGEAESKFNERVAACGFNPSRSVDAYQAGRRKGLKSFCTPEGGFQAGNEGRAYHGVCDSDSEPAFLAQFEVGKQRFTLKAAREAAVRDLDAARQTIQTASAERDRALTILRDASLPAGDRSSAQEALASARFAIDAAEAQIPSLAAAIAHADAQLIAFRDFLAREAASQ